jgi:hypothetical protein
MDPVTALAALLPLGIEAGKAAIQRFIVPDTVKAATFADHLQARSLDLEFFRVMQGGDTGPAWVQAVRSLQRPVFAAAVVLVWAVQETSGGASAGVQNMAGAVGFYLFGDRSLFYIRGGK